MQSKVRNKLKFLEDGGELFKYWISLGKAGSLSLVQAYTASKKMLNTKTGRPVTIMGCWSAMWRWALRNPVEARKLYADYVLELDGDFLTDEEWNSLIHSRAHQLLTPAGYKRYLSNHPEIAKYKDE